MSAGSVAQKYLFEANICAGRISAPKIETKGGGGRETTS
jgi:hypothetical protein